MRSHHLLVRLALLLALLVSSCPAEARTSFLEAFQDPFAANTSLDYSFVGAPVNSLLDQRVNVHQALWRDESTVWRANGRFSDLNSTGTMYPSSLWDIEAGASFDHKIDESRAWGLRASLGSASDIPFNSIHEDVIQVSGHYKIPSGKNNAWFFMLSYSNNRTFANNIPLPGVAYLIRADDKRSFALVGLPFLAVNYAFSKDTSARISYFVPYSISAEVLQRLYRRLRGFAGFEWNQDAWLRANRPDTTQRLYFDSKNAIAGLRQPLSPNLLLELAGGYSFGRRFFEASSVFQQKTSDQDLSPSPFGAAKLTLRL